MNLKRRRLMFLAIVTIVAILPLTQGGNHGEISGWLKQTFGQSESSGE